MRLEEYAMIGDRETAALVSSEGSIDWLAAPAFDGRACFAALLGRSEHGMFSVRPRGHVRQTRRRYVEGTLVLETEMVTDEGAVALVDFMPLSGRAPSIVRVLEGRRGRVHACMELLPRFDYGSLLPYVRVDGRSMIAIGGPDGLSLSSPVPLRRDGERVRAELSVGEGERAAFVLTYFPSHLAAPAPIEPQAARHACISEWRAWSSRCAARGRFARDVLRSLVVLKALNHSPTGAVVASHANVHHWDYRCCFLRDATFTLYALLYAGYRQEAIAWRDWLLRAIAGHAPSIQTIYGLFGERRAQDLRFGAPREQLPIDAYGDLMDAFDLCRRAGVPPEDEAWGLQRGLVEVLESAWRHPDKGIWATRGPPRHYVHSKVMAWVALDRAARAVERTGLPGPIERWRALRAQIHREVCAHGFDEELGSFVQYYGAEWPDANLLMIPIVGFLPHGDPRVTGTVSAIERELLRDGLVARFPSAPGEDAARPIACTFWLADAYLLLGRRRDAIRAFERALDLANDVGLLGESYDLDRRAQSGGFPQALSHIALASTAANIERALGDEVPLQRTG